jgi:hypothetical protein
MDGETARYSTGPNAGDSISYSWEQRVGPELEHQIIQLMRETTASAPIIGFSTTISDAEAAAYVDELREKLAAGKCTLLVIRSGSGDLAGLCTLSRNRNPNNRHITDLSKGMIAERHRGRLVLPAAFYEIALLCERDGIELISLDVRADTPAQHAWERFGFRTYGTLNDYARANGTSFTGHFMMQTVSDLKARAYATLTSRREKLAPAGA